MAEQINFQDRVNQAIQAALAAALPQMLAQVSQATAKPTANVGKNGRDLGKKDASILAGFKRKGVKGDVTLMNRADPKAAFNVRPYRGWLEHGRQVRKGEKSVRGLFHISQTDPIAKKAN